MVQIGMVGALCPRLFRERLAAVSDDRLDVELLLQSVLRFRQGGQSPSDVLIDAGVNSVSDEDLRRRVRAALGARPELLDLWQQWSWDKRWSPSPYLDGLEVGQYDEGKKHVRHHAMPLTPVPISSSLR